MTERSITLNLQDEASTLRLGEDLALALKVGGLVYLSGDLGAGKSTLARALIRAACDDAQMDVPSPTFTLVQTYQGNSATGMISHYDLYRLEDPEEVEELGIDEALETGIALVEWPERGEDYLPACILKIVLEQVGAPTRKAILSGGDAIMLRIERSLAVRKFLTDNWHENVTRRYMLGDASTRTYETAEFADEKRILMNSPPMCDGPIIHNGKPYSQIAHLAENVRPFVAIAKILRKNGFEAPIIHAQDLEAGFLLISHLGEEGVVDANGKPEAHKYLAAVKLLAQMHECRWPKVIPLDDGSDHTVPAYDKDAMMIEVDLLAKWYVPRISQSPIGAHALDEFANIWQDLISRLANSEKSLVLRDYHSPNLLWLDKNLSSHTIGLIDFQDAMVGPCAYDVASLAQDARVTVSPELEQLLVGTYIEARLETQTEFSTDEFREAYAIMAAQRATKVLGIFIRLDERDRKPDYLAHLPRMQSYLKRSLKHPVLGDFKRWLENYAGF